MAQVCALDRPLAPEVQAVPVVTAGVRAAHPALAQVVLVVALDLGACLCLFPIPTLNGTKSSLHHHF